MIGIIGYGFVGQALGSVLRDDYQIVDPRHSQGLSVDAMFEAMMSHHPSIVFICVPTPSNEDGCDDSLVMHYVERLACYNCVVVVKSSVPPTTVDKIMSVRPSTVIWPELLREATAKEDMMSPSLCVIGASDEEIFQQVRQFIMKRTCILIGPELIKHVTPVEASVFKYSVNSFLAMKVVFMHQMHLWATERGVNWDNVADVLALEGRVGASHLRAPGVHGFGFDGTCFPKDTVALTKQAQDDGFNLSLLEQAIEINKQLRLK